jgi:endonuclease/exonuclease/phosphatase family metal-dependent hydrolase
MVWQLASLKESFALSSIQHMFFKVLATILALCTIGLAREVSVVSYNIRYDAKSDTEQRDWSVRRSTLIDYLKNNKELIGLQEVQAHQLNEILKALPHHKSVGVGRADGKNKGEHCPILYDTRHWTVSQTATIWLSDTPLKAGTKSWGNKIPRICTWTRLVDKFGAGLYVFNSHWDHQSKKSREESARLLLREVAGRRYVDEPVIFLGDFNATSDTQELRTLLSASDLRARPLLVDHTSHPATFNHWQPELKAGMRIDHLFFSPFLPVSSSTVETVGNATPASDHHPIHAIFEWDSKLRREYMDLFYLRESVLGKEHGDGNGSIVCWDQPATVRAIGGNKENLKHLKSVIAELNDALEGTDMHYTLSDRPQKKELRVYFAPSSEFPKLGKKEGITIHDNVDGFAALTWNTASRIIDSATVFIATEKSSGQFQRHIILEEVTQTLGIMGDNTVYPESVTFSRGHDQGSAPTLGDVDKKALQLIYGHLKPGDDALQTGIQFSRFWGK